MKPAETGLAYDKITHLWETGTFDISNGIAQHQRAISFVESRGHALDVGCGSTNRLINLFLDEGFTPEGVDVSAEMLRLAKDKTPAITFHQQDICQWPLPNKYDLISAWDSIWHVPLQQQEALIRKLLAALNTGGVLIFSAGGLDEASEHRDDFMGPEVYYSSLGISGFLAVIAGAGGVCRHFEFDQYPELHAYFIVQKL